MKRPAFMMKNHTPIWSIWTSHSSFSEIYELEVGPPFMSQFLGSPWLPMVPNDVYEQLVMYDGEIGE